MKSVWIVTCVYTAEYGSLAIEYQNASFDRCCAVNLLMGQLSEVYREVGGEEVKDDLYEQIKSEIENKYQHRKNWGNGNQYMWSLTNAYV